MDNDSTKTKIELVTSVQRRRRWSVAEKLEILAEAEQPGMSMSYVARKHSIAASQIFRWKKLKEGGALAAIAMRRILKPTLIIVVIFFQFCTSKNIKRSDSSPKQIIYRSHYFQTTEKSDKRIYKDHATTSEVLFTIPELQLVLSGSTVIPQKSYPDDQWISVEWIEIVPIEQESERGSYVKHDGWMRIAGMRQETDIQKEFEPFCDEIATRGRRDFKSKKLEQTGDDGGTWMEPASLNFREQPFIMQIYQTYQVETFLFAKLLTYQPGKNATILAFTKDRPRYGQDVKPIKLKFDFHTKGFHLSAETHRPLVGIPDKFTVSKDFSEEQGMKCRGSLSD